jgi:hypothetical protein
MMHYNRYDSTKNLIKYLFNLSQKIIKLQGDRDAFYGDKDIDLLKYYKLPYATVDLQRVYGLHSASVVVDKEGNRNKFGKSLKQTSINLKWHELLDFTLPPIDKEEYDAYCEYFYGERTPEVEEGFDYAWLHHQHSNPHHWQYWLLREDDGGTKALEIPYEYILEMVCDWWSFSWKNNDLYEIFNWYDNNKKKMILHEKTEVIVENILRQIKDILDKRYSEK